MVFEKYARYYDLLYQDKNYEHECDFLTELFKQYSPFPVTSILEMGCGSGGHAFPLASRNYQVTGFDFSAGMLELARKKQAAYGLKLDLQQASLTDFQYAKTFDAVICMFAALNYITENADLENVLTRVRQHLRIDGLFIIDIWNGLAVLRTLPEIRTKIIEHGTMRIIRMVEPSLDAVNHICRNHYRLLILEHNRLIEEIEETHIIRFLFPREIAYYLEKAGFEVIKMCGFPDSTVEINENIWNITVIARGVKSR